MKMSITLKIMKNMKKSVCQFGDERRSAAEPPNGRRPLTQISEP